MTLGGLALAVGILVDDATVAIENIERNLAQGKDTDHRHSRRRAANRRPRAWSPRCASASCSCPCSFSPASRKFLFVPLAEAVVFAMLASYLLSRTLVPTLAMYLLQESSRRGIRHRATTSFRASSAASRTVSSACAMATASA